MRKLNNFINKIIFIAYSVGDIVSKYHRKNNIFSYLFLYECPTNRRLQNPRKKVRSVKLTTEFISFGLT